MMSREVFIKQAWRFGTASMLSGITSPVRKVIDRLIGKGPKSRA